MSIDDEAGDVELIDTALVSSATAWLQSQIDAGLLKGLVIVTIEEDGIGMRWFGHVDRRSMAFGGALLSNDAINGQYDREPDGSEGRKPSSDAS